MLSVVLYEPEIPPNTGNIIRLCANCGATLHLIKPLGFTLDDKNLQRAGLDYHEFVNVSVHDSFADYTNEIAPQRIIACSTKGKTRYSDIEFKDGDALLFGPETRGLPASILNSFPTTLVARIPMLPHSRSLNLSNSVAIILFEAWRQLRFVGAI